jgi:hypothetical protein
MGELSNGSKIGGIWKIEDNVKFPRLHLLDLRLISLELIEGYADIRSINLEKLSHKSFFATEQWLKSLE